MDLGGVGGGVEVNMIKIHCMQVRDSQGINKVLRCTEPREKGMTMKLTQLNSGERVTGITREMDNRTQPSPASFHVFLIL